MKRILIFCMILILALPTEAVSVPVLMYHHFTEETTGLPNHCGADSFRRHLETLAQEGYTAVTFGDLLAYADGLGELPPKPVVLTSDDGYSSVLEIALPILREFGMTMSVAVVGSRLGTKGDIPHFSLTEAAGTGLELVSHTWDLHGMGVLTEQGELQPELAADTEKMRQIPALEQAVFVYPFGRWSGESETFLRAVGYRITVTTRPGIAQIRQGETDSLFSLPRISMDDHVERPLF